MDFIPKKILLIQLRQIGDVLLTTPAAQVLKDNFPEAKLDFLTQAPCHEALSGNPFIDEVLVYRKESPVKWMLEVRKRKYDLVIDFMSNPRSALICFTSGAPLRAGPAYTSSAWAYSLKLTKSPLDHPYNPFFKIDSLRHLGLKNIFYPYPKIYIPETEKEAAEVSLKKAGFGGAGTLIGMAPASRRITRQWPREHYAALAALAAARLKAEVVIFWGPGEEELAHRIAAAAGSPLVKPAPRTPTLMSLAAMLSKTAVLVSNCNGVKHIAQAAGVPTLGIYGSSRPESWTPPNDPIHRVARDHSLPCAPCGSNECQQETIKCLSGLKPEMVFEELMSMPGLAKIQ
ncbi:MAG: glycosyltransferase family 9 protein [Elusimicrobia bacterium]|nr:glycosyltransferase family 9 protein [Elusimicrobiota bacterium]